MKRMLSMAMLSLAACSLCACSQAPSVEVNPASASSSSPASSSVASSSVAAASASSQAAASGSETPASGSETGFTDYFTQNNLEVMEGRGPIETTAIAFMPDDPATQIVVPCTVTLESPLLQSQEDGYSTIVRKVRTVTKVPLEDYQAGYTTVSFANGLYDLYTGMKFPSQNLSDNEGFDYSNTITVNGVEYTVEYSKENSWEWEVMSSEDGDQELGICTGTYILKIPDGYDGLVYAAMGCASYVPDEEGEDGFNETISYALDIQNNPERDFSKTSFFHFGLNDPIR